MSNLSSWNGWIVLTVSFFDHSHEPQRWRGFGPAAAGAAGEVIQKAIENRREGCMLTFHACFVAGPLGLNAGEGWKGEGDVGKVNLQNHKAHVSLPSDAEAGAGSAAGDCCGRWQRPRLPRYRLPWHNDRTASGSDLNDRIFSWHSVKTIFVEHLKTPHHFYAAMQDMIFVLVILHRFNINFFTILMVNFLFCFIEVFKENIVSILFVRDVLSAHDQWIYNFCFSVLNWLKIELLHQKESIKNFINTDITM